MSAAMVTLLAIGTEAMRYLWALSQLDWSMALRVAAAALVAAAVVAGTRFFVSGRRQLPRAAE